MLTEKQLNEIREHLENAKNPVFFFDNDPDGLCSFLLLQRFIGRGRGVAIKSLPGLSATYFSKVDEFKADYIFVLDKPVIDDDFIELVEKSNIPLVVIDHHNVEKPKVKENYYNTFYESGLSEPVSYLCYKIANRKEDMWIAAIGCITDAFLPDFIAEMKKNYPELINHNYKTAFDILYNTKLGEISQIISFGLRDTTSNVVNMMRFLMKAGSVNELLEENEKNKSFFRRFEQINEKYQKILKKAEESVEDGMIWYSYAGDMSINQYVANELFYKYPHKIIVVVYAKSDIANISLRWEKDIRTATVNAIKGIEGASGGGHEHATGARVSKDKVEEFKKRLLEELEKIRKS